MIPALLLLGCDGTTSSPTSTDGSCALVRWYRDQDGDGFGTSDVTLEACEQPEGWSALGDDCDDARVVVWPGAPHVCWGSDDDDCDGRLDDNLVDGDGDGSTPCDGDCDDANPEVAEGMREVCNGVDDDCDGLVDREDDSVDRWSCGFCPDPAGFEEFRRRRDDINPCFLDPTVSLCRDGIKEFDTLEDGERLHNVTWSRMDWGHRPELMLYLPPGPGNLTDEVQQWSAYAGYRLISLGWPNDGVTDNSCNVEDDRDCFDRVHRERLYGEDVSTVVDVAPNDSVVGRLVTLLRWLAAEHPNEGWDEYLVGDEVQWNRVIVMGWSEGATMAAYLGKDQPLAGEFLLAPGLDIYKMVGGVPDFDPWWGRPAVTPVDRIFTVYSHWDPQAFPVNRFEPVLASFGVTEAPVLIDDAAPPYGGAKLFETRSLQFDTLTCTTHGAVAVDGCTDEAVLMPAYFHVFCTLPQLYSPSR
jgi:hypothetical protein